MATNGPFSKRLKEARLRADLTQEQLGVRAGIDEANASAKMNQYEQGKHIPKFPRLKQLAEALGVPTAYFYAESDELAEFLYHYERVSRKDKQRLLDMVR